MFLRTLSMIFIGVVLFFNIALSAEDDPILAKAGDYVFKKSDFDRLISYSPQPLQQQLKRDPQHKEMLMKRIMQQKIISDLARKEGFDKKADVKEQLQYLVDDFIAKAYILYAVVEKISISEEELKLYYDRNKDKFTTPERARVSHILVKVPFRTPADEKRKAQEKAKQILEWLKKGEKFETLAGSYSDDLESKAKGGSLGYISKGQMSKTFDEVVFSLKPGQISDVIETDLGYHIIQVEDRKDAVTKTFDEVKGSIKDQLTNEKAISRVEEFTKKALKDAGLEVYTEPPSSKGKK